MFNNYGEFKIFINQYNAFGIFLYVHVYEHLQPGDIQISNRMCVSHNSCHTVGSVRAGFDRVLR